MSEPPRTGVAAPQASLGLNFSWTLIGNAVYAATQWGILVALAKLGSPEHVGGLALALAVGAPIVLFSQLHLRAIQATDSSDAYTFGTYLTLRLLTTPLAVLLVAAVALSGNYGTETAATLFLVGIMKAADAVSDVYFGAWQKAEHMRGIAVAQMINGIGSLAALAAGVALTGSIVWGAGGALLGSLASLTFVLRYDGWLRRHGVGGEIHLQADWRILARLAGTALPLGVVMLLVSLNGSIPRYVIERALGQAQLGIFAAVSSLMVIGVTIVNALGQSASPRLARFYATGDPRFGKLLWNLMAVAAGVGLLGVLSAYLAGGWVLRHLYTPDYEPAAGLLFWAMAVAGVYYIASFLGYANTAARQIKAQVPLARAVTVVVATTSGAWIERWGLIGAMWSFGAALLSQALGSVLILSHAFRPLVQERLTSNHFSSGRPLGARQ